MKTETSICVFVVGVGNASVNIPWSGHRRVALLRVRACCFGAHSWHKQLQILLSQTPLVSLALGSDAAIVDYFLANLAQALGNASCHLLGPAGMHDAPDFLLVSRLA